MEKKRERQKIITSFIDQVRCVREDVFESFQVLPEIKKFVFRKSLFYFFYRSDLFLHERIDIFYEKLFFFFSDVCQSESRKSYDIIKFYPEDRFDKADRSRFEFLSVYVFKESATVERGKILYFFQFLIIFSQKRSPWISLALIPNLSKVFFVTMRPLAVRAMNPDFMR